MIPGEGEMMLGVERLEVFLLCRSGKNIPVRQPERVNPGCLEGIADFLQRGFALSCYQHLRASELIQKATCFLV